MTRVASALAGSLLGAALAALLMIALERIFFPEVQDALQREPLLFFGEWRWPLYVLWLGAPVGGFLGGAIGARLGREREGRADVPQRETGRGVTFGMALRRTLISMMAGAALSACVVYVLCLFDEARPLSGSLLRMPAWWTALVVGAPLGLLLGAIVGWFWLVVAVGREQRPPQHARASRFDAR